MIVFALKDLLEAGDRLLEGDQLSGVAGENLSDLEEKSSRSNAVDKIRYALANS